MRVLLTGATGFLGSALRGRLSEAGHGVLPVSRRGGVGHSWAEEDLRQALSQCDAIVHLAGENLFARRWSRTQKALLRSSRIDTTAYLSQLAAEAGVQTLLVASAVGYYGDRGDEELDESSTPGEDFLARLCADWEAAARPAEEAGLRVAHVRLGVILHPSGGALERMLLPFRLGLGGPVGSGAQYVPWVHRDDASELFLFLLENSEARGVYNGTAPEPERMRSFARALGKSLRRPALLPVPGLALRIALGEVAGVLLGGQRALPRRAQEAGFSFAYPSLEPALAHLLR